MPSTLRLLLVEDDPAYAEWLCDELRQQVGDAGLAVTVVSRMSRAVEQARSGRWDAAVLDLSLPDSTGAASFSSLCAAAPHVPIVVLTSMDDEEVAIATLRQGAQEFLVKDAADGRSLHTRIRHAIARHTHTERHRIAQARYRSLAESAVQGILIHDGGVVRFANRALAHLLGVPSPDALVGQEIWGYIAAEDQAMVLEHWRSRVARQPAPARYELRIIRADGSMRWVDCSVSEVSWEGEFTLMAALVDITELKLAMQQLRASDERFRLIADNTREAFIILEQPSGRPLYLSRMWEEISGRPARDAYAAGNPWLDAVHAEDRDAVTAAYDATRGGEATESVFRLRRPDASIRWVRARTFPVRDDRGQVHRIVALLEDITQLRQTEEQLRQAQKMEAIGQLAGGVAHDFNNLLVVITGYGDLVADVLGPTHPLRRDVDAIRAAAQSAAGLTQQLLAFSRRQILQPQVLDLSQSMQRVEQLLRRVIGEHIQLEMALAAPLRRVYADPGQIEQVMMNLAVNARDAMPEGGRLTIETADVDLDATYVAQHPGASPGPHVMIAVTDTGTGMDETTMKRLFEPFFTTKPAGRGTGLGLATVYGIVKQSHGSIWVYSEPGKGSTFKIHLPAAGSPADVEPLPELDAATFTGDETILLLEDQAEVRGVISETLLRHGYAVTAVESSAEAMAIARDGGRRFDLLLTDLVLPDVNGRDIARRIHAARPRLPVLYMSGYTDATVIRDGLLDGGVAFIQKPFSAPTLLRKVRGVLDAACGGNRSAAPDCTGERRP